MYTLTNEEFNAIKSNANNDIKYGEYDDIVEASAVIKLLCKMNKFK